MVSEPRLLLLLLPFVQHLEQQTVLLILLVDFRLGIVPLLKFDKLVVVLCDLVHLIM